MPTIIKDTLHPENESGTDIYPKTSNDQVVGYGQNLEGKDYALVDETCKKPTNLGTPTHVLGVAGSLSNQPISIPIGYSSDNIPKRNANRNVESLYDAINDNEYVRKSQFDKGLSEVSAPVVTITATSTATQGTISSADLAVLQGNKSAIIRFNNELYYFMDDEFKSGYLTYSHVGVDSGVQWVKSITITISSLSWVLTTAQVGGKLYQHRLRYQSSFDVSAAVLDIYIEVLSSSATPLTNTYLVTNKQRFKGLVVANSLASSSPSGQIVTIITDITSTNLVCTVLAHDEYTTPVVWNNLISNRLFNFKEDTVTEV